MGLVDVQASFVADLSESWISISLVENLGLEHFYDSKSEPQYCILGKRIIQFKGTTVLQSTDKVTTKSNYIICRVVDDRTSNFLFLQSYSTTSETPTDQDNPTRDNPIAMLWDSGYVKCYRCQSLGRVQAECPTVDLGGAGTTTDRDDLIRDNITTMSRDSGYASGISHKVVDHGHRTLKYLSDLQLAMPAPLMGNSDLDMVKLASSISCQFCGKTGPLNSGAPLDQWHPGPGENESVPIWAFNIRSCGGCLQSRCIKEIDLLLSSPIPWPLIIAFPFINLTNELRVIPAATLNTAKPPGGIQITKCFLPGLVEELEREFIKVNGMGSAVKGEWLKGLDTRGRSRMNDIAGWERWQASSGSALLHAVQDIETQLVQKASSISECDVNLLLLFKAE